MLRTKLSLYGSTSNSLKIVFKEGVLNKYVSIHSPFYLYASKFITYLFSIFIFFSFYPSHPSRFLFFEILTI